MNKDVFRLPLRWDDKHRASKEESKQCRVLDSIGRVVAIGLTSQHAEAIVNSVNAQAKYDAPL